jgi:nucleoside-diphosphate-sugar epimerase
MSVVKNMVVTGGSGKVGSELVAHLLAGGHKVTVIDRKPPTCEAPFIFADVSDRSALHPVMQNTDVVIHLADIPNNFLLPIGNELMAKNVAGATAVLQTAADCKVRRIIYASTTQVYGSWGDNSIPPQRLPVTEDHPLRPRNPYAVSKVANEYYARYLAESKGHHVMVVRFPGVYFNGLSRGWWNHLNKENSKVHELGTYIFVQDLARGLKMAAESDWTGFQQVHFASRDSASSTPIRQRLIKHHPEYPLLPADWPDYQSLMDCSNAKHLLGWEAQHCIHPGYGSNIIPITD